MISQNQSTVLMGVELLKHLKEKISFIKVILQFVFYSILIHFSLNQIDWLFCFCVPLRIFHTEDTGNIGLAYFLFVKQHTKITIGGGEGGSENDKAGKRVVPTCACLIFS